MSHPVIRAIAWQAEACAQLGAPFYAGLLERVRDDVAQGGMTARLFAPWAEASAEKARRDGAVLRLLASLHALALSGRAPDLAARFPPQGLDVDHAWTACRTALTEHEALVEDSLKHEPQTNEVRRSACLLGGFLHIARETALPLRCFEIGASAGLNSLWDTFRYRVAGRAWGDAASPVALESRWEGAIPPLDAELRVVKRRACDRRPIDLGHSDDVTRLLSYVWPEQDERLRRLRAAIDLARAVGPAVEAENASTWVRRALPVPGAATVVFHTVVMQYMPEAERSEFTRALDSLGARATHEAPLAWLRLEPDRTDSLFELRLTLWPTGEDRVLAEGHPHGEFAIWR